MVERLKVGEKNRQLLQKVQQYAVNVYDQHYKLLYGTGKLEVLDDQLSVLVDEEMYSDETGLRLDACGGQGNFM